MKRLDNGDYREDSMLLEVDLEAIDDILYEPKEEELIARTFLDIYDGISEGAETYSYDQFSRGGSAKRTPTGADDVPLVDNEKERISQKIISIETGFKIEKQELRAARESGTDIDTSKAETARRIVAEDENDLVFLGDTALGVEGLVNADNINTKDAPDGAANETEWEHKTGQEIIDDIRVGRAVVNGQAGYTADTLIVPSEQYQELSKPYNDYNSDTIMTYLTEQGWFEEVLDISSLEGAGGNNEDCALILDTSPSNMQLGLSIDMVRDEPYKLENGSYKVRVEERTCGVILRRPSAICRVDGI